MDIGGHRFFSKNDWVMRWWLEILPLASDQDGLAVLGYQNKKGSLPDDVPTRDPSESDEVMLVRDRLSRIYHNGEFFPYPLKASPGIVLKLGVGKSIRAGFSYLHARLRPIRKERNLEHFLINRFGRVLYETFFEDYTRKVWGVPCSEISAEWGAQRIKGLSISKALWHAIKSPFSRFTGSRGETETTLIESFLYPKKGPGQLWEVVKRNVQQRGGSIRMNTPVQSIELRESGSFELTVENHTAGKAEKLQVDHVISSMPIQGLLSNISPEPPGLIQEIAAKLVYRDFLTVGLLLRKMTTSDGSRIIPDNWIYIQDDRVRMGRLQVFNNWSPAMVSNPEYAWIGLEYFCDKGDDLWRKDENEMIRLALRELSLTGLADEDDFLDGVVVRQEKAYPAYFGGYERFAEIRDYLDSIPGLFPVGRNGMHRYNNQDHSMLSALYAVESIVSGKRDKREIWSVNAEGEYHEER